MVTFSTSNYEHCTLRPTFCQECTLPWKGEHGQWMLPYDGLKCLGYKQKWHSSAFILADRRAQSLLKRRYLEETLLINHCCWERAREVLHTHTTSILLLRTWFQIRMHSRFGKSLESRVPTELRRVCDISAPVNGDWAQRWEPAFTRALASPPADTRHNMVLTTIIDR